MSGPIWFWEWNYLHPDVDEPVIPTTAPQVDREGEVMREVFLNECV